MKLVIGLGNVGQKYHHTRHNIAWLVLNELAKGAWHDKSSKFHAYVAEVELAGQKCLLAKPTTMMNDSGRAAAALKQFYKVDNSDIIVVHDELDIIFGDVKAKQGGSNRTHNGLDSVSAAIGNDYQRIRIGIDAQPRPIPEPRDFVLSKLTHDEEEQLPAILGIAREKLSLLLST